MNMPTNPNIEENESRSPGVDYEGCDAYIRERAERFPCKGGKKCLGDILKGESTYKHIIDCPARDR